MGGVSIFQLLILIVFLFVFLIPTFIARRKNHPHKTAIMLTNILGGLFVGAGWLIALIWCFIEPKKESRGTADELSKLHELKEKGVISEEEFNKKKAELL